MSTSISRRSLIAAGAALAVPIFATVPALATTGADPIFAAIEAHKAAEARFSAAVHVQSEIEQLILDDDERDDDPRWIAAEKAWRDAHDAADPWVLIDTRPTTFAGVAAVLKYAADYVMAGNQWPSSYHGDEDRGVAFHRNIATAVTQIAAGRLA